MKEFTREVKERPILFNGDMVRAILDGRKTQTRRVVKVQPVADNTAQWSFCADSTNRKRVSAWTCAVLDVNGKRHTTRGRERVIAELKCPYGNAGDRLWVRETACYNATIPPVYRADIDDEGYDLDRTWRGGCLWTPSIHMPRWASRITLEVTEVRVQRLQEISENDAVAEGVQLSQGGMWCGAPHKAHGFPRQHNTATEAFSDLWNSIYGTWGENPWVWAVSFRRVV